MLGLKLIHVSKRGSAKFVPRWNRTAVAARVENSNIVLLNLLKKKNQQLTSSSFVNTEVTRVLESLMVEDLFIQHGQHHNLCGSREAKERCLRHIMTSSNGIIFRVTDPLCGEFTGPGEFPAQRSVTRSFYVFIDTALIYAWINDWLNTCEVGDLRRNRGHYEVNVMSHGFVLGIYSKTTIYFRQIRCIDFFRTVSTRKYAHVIATWTSKLKMF